MEEMTMSDFATTANRPGADKPDYATLRSDMDALKSDMRNLADDAKKYAAHKGSEALEKGKELAGETSARMKAATESIEQKVRDNPLAALGVAFGVGVLLASLARR